MCIRDRQETIAIPFEHFYLLAVLGEEDEYRTTKWRKFHLGSHNLLQTVYAHVHSDISLADVIPVSYTHLSKVAPRHSAEISFVLDSKKLRDLGLNQTSLSSWMNTDV